MFFETLYSTIFICSRHVTFTFYLPNVCSIQNSIQTTMSQTLSGRRRWITIVVGHNESNTKWKKTLDNHCSWPQGVKH